MHFIYHSVITVLLEIPATEGRKKDPKAKCSASILTAQYKPCSSTNPSVLLRTNQS